MSLQYHSIPREFSQAISHGFPSIRVVAALESLTELSPSYFPRFPFHPPSRRFRIAPSQGSSQSPHAISHGFPSVHPVVASISLLPNKALPKLFPTVSRPSTLSSLQSRSFSRSSPRAISHGFPSVHPVVASISLLPHRTFNKVFPTVSCPSTPSSLPSRSFHTELSPNYFPRFPFPPLCCRFHLAPLPRSSPRAISHGFPFVHPVVASVSLLPNGALPKLFPPTVSCPSTLLSLPSRSFARELSPNHFPRFPFPPLCCRFHLAPLPRSSPRAISHGFPFVHPVVASVSLLPNGALPKLFPPTVSCPSTLLSLPSRSFARELSPLHPFTIFPTVSSLSTQSSLPSVPSQRTYFPQFPLRPPSRHFRIAPSRQVQLNENPSIGDAFGKKVCTVQICTKSVQLCGHPNSEVCELREIRGWVEPRVVPWLVECHGHAVIASSVYLRSKGKPWQLALSCLPRQACC